ncbi:hypothetical protein HYH03_002973 [Edaphochlamys debaryana]|uniref:Uncharacterized protein n=1 Tax=Edaphochlamys debaryana TaxID=47281 RepID=A0A835YKK4_9CHLO|nr:hypothetical protein HYH03_002973 [Edaphochlamys debaryana]|eukprot:KAG2499399.1 hypothetical protein HYH03_002973 [Edaphochlamys debaryana]
MPKVPGSSFNHPPNVPVFMDTAPRWPQENPTWPKTLKATMGYKGIETDYLPASTVTLNAVDLKGTKERNYNFL